MQKRSKRLCLALAVLLSVSMVLVALVPAVEAASYKKGSSGAVVTQIQTKLKSWGYYTGTVDGIYGSGTERAVRAFQQKNGLTVDGKAGDRRWRPWDCPRAEAIPAIPAVPAARPVRRSICSRA